MLNSSLKLKESGSTPTYYTILQSADLTGADSTYTLPAALPGVTGYVLSSTDAGVMSWVAQSAGASDHGDLGELAWSEAGHTLDADLEFDNDGKYYKVYLDVDYGFNQLLGS
jgi:beta-xylosidase